MKKAFLSFVLLPLIFSCTRDEFTSPIPPVAQIPELGERLNAGGETTVFVTDETAFENPSANLTAEQIEEHDAGDEEFDVVFDLAGSDVSPGLGPRFNHNQCSACHPADGRSEFPADINELSGLLYRVSIGNDLNTGPLEVPNYGKQAQNQAIPGIAPELDYKVTWEEITETLLDGTVVNLRKPTFSYENPYMPVPQNLLIAPRIAPPIIGLGLLEAIPESDILALVDENDQNGDNISGKANYVINPETGVRELGRFGWKANTSTLRVQTAGAYLDDMGITSDIFSMDEVNDGFKDDPEISSEVLELVTFYTQTLAVPAPRNIEDENIRRGSAIFESIQCASCHVPKQRTLEASIDALANQTIWPYTDMLLHDMGEGLSDGRADFLATETEWKTRPLWGIGLTETVSGHTDLLHDGRARNIMEAILWHGGEAQASKDKFKILDAEDRADLMAFINSM